MEQVYFPYWLWEDYKAGMWRDVFGEERDKYLQEAIEFTGNARRYGSYMQKVVKRWPHALAVVLTNPSMNHQAFVGHCACCLALGCPEDITRLAWHTLSEAQQAAANLQADKAIALWFTLYRRGIQLCLRLD